jgi:hypothetical protein
MQFKLRKGSKVSNNFRVFPYILILLLCACAPTQRSLIAEQALCVPIGLDEERMDLCVLNIHNWNHNYWTNHYFIVTEGNISDVDGLGGGFETYDMLVSPSRQFIAITENGGEGHPYFSAFYLDDIRNGNKPTSIASIEAYPSGFFGLEWQGDNLFFSTETDLLSSMEIRNETDWLYEFHYQLDAGTGQLVQLGEPAPIKNQ